MENKIKNQSIRKYNIDRLPQVVSMAKVLKDYVIKNNLYANIVGKNYVLVEGWQFAGGLLGLFPKVVEVKDLGEGKWFAKVDIVEKRTDKVVSSGFALCSTKESKKRSFDEYAILSMAQTRAIGKAYRNYIGWVMKLAGYEATPAEEMKNKKTEDIKTDKTSDKKMELKLMLKGRTDKEKIEDLKKKTGIKLNDFEITEKHAGILVANLLNKSVK